MKNFLILLGISLLTGCIEHDAMKRARMDYACIDQGGVYEYSWLNSGTLTCNSGKKLSGEWYEGELPEEFWLKSED